MRGDKVLVAGTFDTKRAELLDLRECLAGQRVKVRTVDLSTSGKPSSADVPPHVVAAYHRGGAGGVFTGDRGASVRAMAEAFENWIVRQQGRSEEHTSELQSLMRISYAVFCLKKKTITHYKNNTNTTY